MPYPDNQYSLAGGSSYLPALSGWGSPNYGLAPVAPQASFDAVGGGGLRAAPTSPVTQLGLNPTGSDGGGFLDWFKGINWLDKPDANGAKTPGVLAPTLGVASGLFNAWMGMKQYGLAKDQLAESKKQFQLNYDAQRATTNSQLEDRQRARVASNPGAYQSVGDYMAANGIKGG